MEAIILLAHGSRSPGACDAALQHAERLRAVYRNSRIEVAFLNQIDPDLPKTLSECVASGINRVVIAPYFIVAGTLLSKELPPLVEQARSRYPMVDICVADPIGYDDSLTEAALELACERFGHAPDALVLLAHGSAHPHANAPFDRMIAGIRERHGQMVTRLGFLERSEPTCYDAIAASAEAGARRIAVVPCFLLSGNHVLADLPPILEKARAQYMGTDIQLTSALGDSPHLTGVLAKRIGEALEKKT